MSCSAGASALQPTQLAVMGALIFGSLCYAFILLMRKLASANKDQMGLADSILQDGKDEDDYNDSEEVKRKKAQRRNWGTKIKVMMNTLQVLGLSPSMRTLFVSGGINN